MSEDFEHSIRLRGVRVHNLKGLDLDLPRDRLIVVTGVSGSGKSSLAFDTLYAEGQRRYVETFSAYTRQFLERLDKPDADTIEGLPPAIAVGQRGGRRSPRSTVGTVTEVHEALALLYARASRLECMKCGREVRPADPEAVADWLAALPDGTRYLIAFPIDLLPGTDLEALASILRDDGFNRVRVDGQVAKLDDGPIPAASSDLIEVIVDRLIRGSEAEGRVTDSVELAFDKGLGRCRIVEVEGGRTSTFYRGWRCGGCGTDYPAPEPRLFRYNSPVGACPECEGFGRVETLDLDRIVPDPSKSLEGGAVAPWSMPAYRNWGDDLIARSKDLDIPIDRPFAELTADQVARVVEGGSGFGGLRGFFKALERKQYKMHVRIFLARWRGWKPCPSCVGRRLRPEALAFKLGGLSIADLAGLAISGALEAVRGLGSSPEGEPGRVRALAGVRSRLEYLERIGLGYLTLDRPARSLSGGEARRVALTKALGSGLVGTLYILDEPTIGLHPRDVGRLVAAMERLRDAGNSVVVVEHDESVMRAADRLVEIGPGAGEFGGRLVYEGPPAGIVDVPDSPTGAFLSGRLGVATPGPARSPDRGSLILEGATGNNLKDLDATFPLGLICAVAGVSGSGKSTLVARTLYPALIRVLESDHLPGEPYRALRGAESIGAVVLVDQSPIGRTPRSNPVTYLKAFDEIRGAFAATHEAKVRDYGPGRFSFNVEGGRCDACEGNGYQVVDMQFLADLMVRCPECRGTRYRAETLEVKYRGMNIAEVLEMTARAAFGFFKNRPKVQARLRPLIDVGLDYLRLGQPANTLSGGEAQRLKLAAHLAGSPSAVDRSARGPKTLFLLDEPTIGLHPADVARLLDCLNALADLGHSLILIEHNPAVLAAADWIIELGPEAGEAGGRIVSQGPPGTIARAETPTGRVLEGTLAGKSRG